MTYKPNAATLQEIDTPAGTEEFVLPVVIPTGADQNATYLAIMANLFEMCNEGVLVEQLQKAVTTGTGTVVVTPLVCPECDYPHGLTIEGTVALTPHYIPGDAQEFETVEAVGLADYHDHSRTCCECGWAGELKEARRKES